ncbi:hypothetical protein [Lentibacillus kimchii]|uniref:hypothetical protein n=1 Tax=Lentibacillus kimchii TaxID=1542911 RepID=UPI0036D271B0
MLVPILAALPFSTQFLVDRKTNYYELMMMRSGKYKYLFSMLAVSAFAGFLAIAIPLLINFLLFSLTFPAIHPDPFVYYTQGLFSFKTLFYSLQLNFPLIHTLFYIFLSGIIGSLFAVFSAALCLHIRFSLISLVIPVIISILISGLSELVEVGLSPIDFLDMNATAPVYLWCIALFGILMIMLTFILAIIGVRRLVR